MKKLNNNKKPQKNGLRINYDDFWFMFSVTVNVTQLRWFRNLKRAPNTKVFVILILTKMTAMFDHNETTPTRVTVINDNSDVFRTWKCHMSDTPTYWIRCVWNTLQLRSSLSIRLCYNDGLHSNHTSWRRPREHMCWNTCSTEILAVINHSYAPLFLDSRGFLFWHWGIARKWNTICIVMYFLLWLKIHSAVLGQTMVWRNSI